MLEYFDLPLSYRLSPESDYFPPVFRTSICMKWGSRNQTLCLVGRDMMLDGWRVGGGTSFPVALCKYGDNCYVLTSNGCEYEIKYGHTYLDFIDPISVVGNANDAFIETRVD